MNNRVVIHYLLLLFSSFACAQPKIANTSTKEYIVAFPGAEGFGKYTTGGRSGKVMIVTNLNDDGPGSFREAVTNKKTPRIIVFAISGTIHLQSKLNIAGDLTIAGQSAPGDGICLADYPVSLNGDNIIIRYMRFRMGDKNQRGGMVDGNGGDDAFGGVRRKNIIIDHCSMSWSTDEVCSVYAGDSTTLQWNLISEPLNYSYHFEIGDKDYEHHGYGGILGGKHITVHHNLYAHCNSRTPRWDGIRNAPEESGDFRNNVIYDWGENNMYAGEGGSYNVVNNYYKAGPSTKATVFNRMANPYKTDKIPFGKWYVSGNMTEGNEAVTKDNWGKGVQMNKGTEEDKQTAKLDKPFPIVELPTQTADKAYEAILKYVGASYRRDTLDARIINDVKGGKGGLIDVQGGFPHGTAYEATIKAWPSLQSLPAPADQDTDGIPDDWEKKMKLNPADKNDAILFTLDKRYMNIEVYINSLLKQL
jgi:hypothetical protein